MIKILQNFFQLKQNETTVSRECLAGITTFLTMAYIVFVNPAILSDAGINLGAAFAATCLAAAFGSILSGLLSNYPLAIAPGMGLNAYFTYVVVKELGVSWQAALGMVFLSGVLFFILTVSNVRQKIIAAIPKSLIIGIAAGIGFFLALIALKNIGVVVPDKNTLMRLGDVSTISSLLFLIGFSLIIVLNYFKIIGAILWSILAITLLSLLLGLTKFHGIVALPPSLSQTFMALDIVNGLHLKNLLIIFAFFLIALFDSTGTVVGVLQGTHFNQDPKKLKKLSNILLADSITTMGGAMVGTTTTTPYVESAAGIKVGGRTGLTAIVVGLLFLVVLFFAPLAQTIPVYATSAALLYVGCLMLESLAEMNWQDISEYIPGIITLVMIPCTFSIADGVGLGFITYVLIKLLCGKYKDLNPMLLILAVVFLGYFFLDINI